MGLSPYALEIHKDTYATKVLLQADWLILENSEKATLNIKMPSNCLHDGLPYFQKSIC